MHKLNTLIVLVTLNIAVLAQGKVQTKLGIFAETSGKTQLLRPNDQIYAGDKFRIYIKVLSAQFVYVFFIDDNKAYLLNNKKAKVLLAEGKELCLPSETEQYKIDNESKSVRIFIVCSATKLESIEGTFGLMDKIDKERWLALETQLSLDKPNPNKTSEKYLAAAGKVRAADDVYATLPVLSAKNYLIKKYTVEVK